MPTPTYTPLANITLGSSAASVTFSSISQAYRDLILVVTGTTTSDTIDVVTRYNGDSGSNYSVVMAYGTGSSTGSGASTRTYTLSGRMGTNVSTNVFQIMDYSATDKHKTEIARGNDPATFLQMTANRWANTAAITSINVALMSGNFNSATSFSLFGIAS
jgi:hypothetical protein